MEIDGSRQIWDVKAGLCLKTPSKNCTALDFDDNSIITANKSKKQPEIEEWDRRSGLLTVSYPIELRSLNHMVIHENRLFVSSDNTLAIVDREQQKIVDEFHLDTIINHLTQNNSLLFATSYSKNIHVWDVRTSKKIMEFSLQEPTDKVFLYPHTVLHQEQTLLTCNSNTVKFWDMRQGKKIDSFENSYDSPFIDLQGKVLARRWSHTELTAWDKLAMWPYAEELSLWNIDTRDRITSLSTAHEELVAIHWVGTSIFGITIQGKVVVWEPC